MSGFLRVLRRVAKRSQISSDSSYFFMLSLATPRDFSNDLMPPSHKSESVKVISSSVCNFGSSMCGAQIAVAHLQHDDKFNGILKSATSHSSLKLCWEPCTIIFPQPASWVAATFITSLQLWLPWRVSQPQEKGTWSVRNAAPMRVHLDCYILRVGCHEVSSSLLVARPNMTIPFPMVQKGAIFSPI